MPTSHRPSEQSTPPWAARAYADTLGCIGFFSRIPLAHLPRGRTMVPTPLPNAVAALPLAAVVIALPAALVVLVLSALGAPPLPAACLGIAALAITTGALHEDGLADVADGFWGGRDRDHILTIMKDSRTGAYGALALVLAVLARVSLLAAVIAAIGAVGSALVLLAAAAVARTAMLHPWTRLPPARPAGVAGQLGAPAGGVVRSAFLGAAVVTALTMGAVSPLGAILGAALAAAVTLAGSALADRTIGGHTGDVLGAVAQVSEIAFLLGVTICVG